MNRALDVIQILASGASMYGFLRITRRKPIRYTDLIEKIDIDFNKVSKVSKKSI